jgi:hypothetical protein
MTVRRRRIVVLVFAALWTGAALFAGTSVPGVVDDAQAAKAGGAKAEAE